MSMPMVKTPAAVNAAQPMVDFAHALQAYATAHGEMVHGAFGTGTAFDTHRERAGQWYAAIVEAVEEVTR